MQISVTDAKGQLTELVRRAEKGDEIVLTRHGHAAVRLVPVKAIGQEIPPGAARSGARRRRSQGESRAERCPKPGLPL
jgi:prevent-host-death family protein